jgi:hypothetical protein
MRVERVTCDRALSFRVPEGLHDLVQRMARERLISIADYARASLTSY